MSDVSESRGVWIAVIALTTLQVVDGIDLVNISLAASSIRKDWAISDAVLGALLGAAQFGAIFAGIVIGRLSEMLGVRRLLVIAALLMTMGSVMTALENGAGLVLMSRILTGIGLGGTQPLTIGYVGRNLPKKRQPLAIITITAGLAIGQMIAGVAAAPVIQGFGWRAMFWLSALLSLSLVPILLLLLRRSADVMASAAEGGDAPARARSESGLGYVWRSGLRTELAVNLLLCCNGSVVFYFMVSWMPVLLRRLGLELGAASLATTFLSAGGLVGSFILGPWIGRSPFRVVGTSFTLAGVLLAIVSLPFVPSVAVLGVCLVLGLTFVATYFSSGVFITTVFPVRTHLHMLGVSTVTTRTGGMLGPMIVGALLAAGLSVKFLFASAALLVGSVGIFTVLIGRSIERRPGEPDRSK